jgi:hypothetical protein
MIMSSNMARNVGEERLLIFPIFLCWKSERACGGPAPQRAVFPSLEQCLWALQSSDNE